VSLQKFHQNFYVSIFPSFLPMRRLTLGERSPSNIKLWLGRCPGVSTNFSPKVPCIDLPIPPSLVPLCSTTRFYGRTFRGRGHCNSCGPPSEIEVRRWHHLLVRHGTRRVHIRREASGRVSHLLYRWVPDKNGDNPAELVGGQVHL